jgi:uncharacterized protein DUF6970
LVREFKAVKAMPRHLLLIAGLFVGACGVQSPSAPEPLPAWLDSLIRELSNAPVANPPASIARYEYKGEVVYYLPPRCCDIQGNVYQLDGRLLCHPDGGLSGRGDGRCPDFLSERKNERVVWRDPRSSSP